MNQVQSRRVLIGVGVAALALLASPFVLQSWNSSRELGGKVLAFEGLTKASNKDLLGCLVQHPEGGLALTISRENEFFDAQRGLAVRIERADGGSTVRAWLDPSSGAALIPGEQAQLKGCLTPPPAPTKP